MNTIPLNIRRQQLVKLREQLKELVDVLEKDAGCQWTAHFRNSLAEAEALLASDFTQEELNLFAASVNSVYGGAGSFNDYAPLVSPASGRPQAISGMENFDQIASAVYERAVELRAIAYR